MHVIIWLLLLPLKIALAILHGVLLLILLPFFLPIYFLPTIIAVLRGHPDRFAIFVLNLLLGWNAVGWVVALVWSFTATALRRV